MICQLPEVGRAKLSSSWDEASPAIERGNCGACLARSEIRSQQEETGLGVGRGAGSMRGPWGAAGYAHYAEDLHFGESGARDEHAQDVAVEVRRGEVHTLVE
jgi:hypothetical protein